MCFKSTRKKTIVLELRSYEDSIYRIVNQHFLECMSTFNFQFTKEKLDKDTIQLCMRLS